MGVSGHSELDTNGLTRMLKTTTNEKEWQACHASQFAQRLALNTLPKITRSRPSKSMGNGKI